MLTEKLLTHREDWVRTLIYFLISNQGKLQDFYENSGWRVDDTKPWSAKKRVYQYYVWFDLNQKRYCMFSSLDVELLFLNSAEGTITSSELKNLTQHLINEA